jgi:DUF2917 family protein
MNRQEFSATYDLNRGDTLAMTQACGAAVEVSGGDVWMTQFGDANDYVMRDGKRQVKSDGSVLIYAFRDARIVLRGPGCLQVQLRRHGEAPVPVAEAPSAWPLIALWRRFAFA